MGQQTTQEAETETYLRAVSRKGDYGCEIPVNADHAVIESSEDSAICYNEDDDVSNLLDHSDPERQFGENYSQYDWYCWVDEFELIEKEVGDSEPDDEMLVVFATSGGFHLVVERDSDMFEIDGNVLYADEDGIVYDSGMWQTSGDESRDKGIFFNELHFTTYGDAMDMIEAKESE